MSAPIRTFSGAHTFRPQCVVTAAREIFDEALAAIHPSTTSLAPEWAVAVAERVTKAIGEGICPRCSDPLRPNPAPERWRPAGSRATRCRCIPVCETCASWAEPFLGVLAVTRWPTDRDDGDDGDDRTRKEIEAELIEKAKARCKVAVLETGPAGTVLVTSEGATPFEVQPRPHPGGWLEFGYDDTADVRERES